MRTSETSSVKGFIVWVMIVAGLFFGLVSLVATDSDRRISTDLMTLLPVTEQNPGAANASRRFMENFTQRVVMIISSPSKADVHEAASLLEQQLEESDIFRHLLAGLDPKLQENTGRYYYPYRFNLLNSHQRSMPDAQLGNQLISDSLNTIAGPMGIASSRQLLDDPLFLMQSWFYSLQEKSGNLRPDNGFLMAEKDGQYHIMIAGLLREGALSMNGQTVAVNAINGATEYVESTIKTVKVTASGMVFHGAAGADSARKEVSTIGLGSLLGVVLIVLAVFRSSRPLLFSFLSIAVGILAGYLSTILVFGHVHVMTLVFGASLIGISIDYSFHYMVEWWRKGSRWSPVQGLKHIFPGISLGLLTSLLGYLPMLATPFPGLRQIALFSCTGLIAAWLTVVFAYPYLLRQHCRSYDQASLGRCLTLWAAHFIACWQKLLNKSRKFWLSIIVLSFVIMLPRLFMLTANDDIRQLQKRSPVLEAADEFVRGVLGDVGGGAFYLVHGISEQEVLERDEQLASYIQKLVNEEKLESFQAISRVLPSVNSQQASYQKLRFIYDNQLGELWSQLGVTEAGQRQAQDSLESAAGKELRPGVWLKSKASTLYGYLWLGNMDNRYYSAVLIQGVKPGWNPGALAEQLDSVIYVDKTTDTSSLFGRYRVLMGWLLAMAYGVITLIISRRFGFRGALKVVIPPILSVLLTLSVFGLIGQQINLFHMLALLMILGIGVDYTLFIREAGVDSRYTFVAITLSAITTALSFGLLALSETAAIQGFGLTVLLGICFCYLFSPLASRRM